MSLRELTSYIHTASEPAPKRVCPGAWCGHPPGTPLDPLVRLSLEEVFDASQESPTFRKRPLASGSP